MYTENDLVRIAKRENNKKRNYLVVNPLQGKHVPVSPRKALDVFSQLAGLLDVYRGERILIVGFAETATAIGAQAAVSLNADYIQTTREDMGKAACFYFSEEHSHATEQKLVREDIDKIIGSIDRIVFAEDEITTGKTILNIISVIEEYYQRKYGNPWKMKFSVVSILNGMTEELLEAYQSRNIGVHYLVKTQHAKYPQMADSAVNDGVYYDKNISEAEFYACYEIEGAIDSRRVTASADYLSACQKLYDEITKCIPVSEYESILILGTEEFMFPGLYVGKCLEDKGHFVRFHATTRSPIHVSRDETYPLHERYALSSLYDKNRKTFVYDIASYDAVIVMTDAQTVSAEGACSLLNAVRKHNEKVYLVKWQGHCAD